MPSPQGRAPEAAHPGRRERGRRQMRPAAISCEGAALAVGVVLAGAAVDMAVQSVALQGPCRRGDERGGVTLLPEETAHTWRECHPGCIVRHGRRATILLHHLS